MEPFHLDFMSILIQIDSSGARQVETDTRNGRIYDDLYPHRCQCWFQKKISWKQFELRTIGAHRWIELVELYWKRSLDELGINFICFSSTTLLGNVNQTDTDLEHIYFRLFLWTFLTLICGKMIDYQEKKFYSINK